VGSEKIGAWRPAGAERGGRAAKAEWVPAGGSRARRGARVAQDKVATVSDEEVDSKLCQESSKGFFA
jgi:hypothetical protein